MIFLLLLFFESSPDGTDSIESGVVVPIGATGIEGTMAGSAGFCGGRERTGRISTTASPCSLRG